MSVFSLILENEKSCYYYYYYYYHDYFSTKNVSLRRIAVVRRTLEVGSPGAGRQVGPCWSSRGSPGCIAPSPPSGRAWWRDRTCTGTDIWTVVLLIEHLEIIKIINLTNFTRHIIPPYYNYTVRPRKLRNKKQIFTQPLVFQS